jgi:prefoldin subunit 5
MADPQQQLQTLSTQYQQLQDGTHIISDEVTQLPNYFRPGQPTKKK